MSSAKLILTCTTVVLLLFGISASVNAETLLVTDNLLVRLETVGTNAVTVDGGNVTSWNDQAALGGTEDFTDQSDPTKRPALLNGVTPAGKDALSFDGASDVLAHLGNDVDLTGATYTWFSVFKMSVPYASRPATAQYSHLLANATVDKSKQWGTWVYGGSNYIGTLARNAAADDSSMVLGSFADDDIGWHILTGVWNGSAAELNGLAAQTINERIDSTSMGSDAGGLGAPVSPQTGIYVGGTRDANQFMSGQIAATLIYDTALGAADVQAVESYLNSTYLTPVPEPSSLVLLAIAGMFGLVGFRRRSR